MTAGTECVSVAVCVCVFIFPTETPVLQLLGGGAILRYFAPLGQRVALSIVKIGKAE